VASGGFNRTLETAARGLLGALLTGERAVHIVALPQAEESGHYRVPGLAYTAVLDEDDEVRLFHKVNIRHLTRMTADGKPDGPLNIFGEVTAPSQALDRIVASGDMEKVFESIGETAPEPLLKEAEAYMALFGGELADDLRVDRFVVKLRALGPDGGRPFSVSQPFVRKGGKWVPERSG